MTGTAAPPRLCRLERRQLQPWLGQLTQWLLPGASYAIEHTWPQLYRSDGGGRFLGLFEGEALVSHVAWRAVDLLGERTPLRAALLGSVATAPQARGRGHASRLLRQAIDDCRQDGVDCILLWAEQPQLYARAGFRDGDAEPAVLLLRRPHADARGIRLATIADHERLHALHRHKPLRVDRTAREMSALLTTPGLTTMVLEQDGGIAAYACCGKGADLQGWWHECGGDDDAVARLLAGSMLPLGQTQAPVLLPPYRRRLLEALGRGAGERFHVGGPMRLDCTPRGAQRLFVDGLDSV